MQQIETPSPTNKHFLEPNNTCSRFKLLKFNSHRIDNLNRNIQYINWLMSGRASFLIKKPITNIGRAWAHPNPVSLIVYMEPH